jgi:hypothetical protein
MREFGMYSLMIHNCPPEPSRLDTRHVHRPD